MRDPVLERRYIGCAMVDPTVLDRCGIGLDHMTGQDERNVLECLFSLRDRDEMPSEESLRIELQRRGYTRQLGLDPYSWTTASTDVAALATRLRELSDARAIHKRAVAIQAACEDGRPDLAREHMREMWDLRQSGTSETRVKSLQKVWEVFAEDLLEAGTRKPWPGLDWPTVDAQVRLMPGQLLVLGAQTNVGKTTALATWALRLAQGSKTRRQASVGLISVEDSAVDLGAKWMGQTVKESPEKLFFGTADDRARILARFKKEHDAGAADVPLFFSDVVDRSLDSVLMDMSHMKSKHGVEVIMIDYLQALQLPSGSRDIRTGMNQILGQLIAQAGRLGVALILASQLSRPPKDKPHREPTKHDLKESGDVENRAQAIVMLWRDEQGQVWGKVDKVKQARGIREPFRLEHLEGSLDELRGVYVPDEELANAGRYDDDDFAD